MRRKSLGFGLFAALLALLGGGCKKASEEATPSKFPTNALAAPAPQTITSLRLHWLGMKRLAAETNAPGFLSIWKMPETRKLEAQTLDRLALALTGGTALTNLADASSAVHTPTAGTNHIAAARMASSPLRPILDDLEGEESYWEVRQTGTKAGELALAIRLSEARTALWQSNLTAALGASTAASTTGGFAGQWQFTNWPGHMTDGSLGPRTLELSRAGDWTVVGLAAQSNGLAGEIADRIQRDHAPFGASVTNFWLTAEINPQAFSDALALGFRAPGNAPVISLAVSGDGAGVHTHGQLDFPHTLPASMDEPWNIPTNLIHEPLVTFTAIRGAGPWLSSLNAWTNLGVGPAPNQLYFWAQGGLPFISYCAAPFPNASNVVGGVTEDLLKVNPWLDTNGIGIFQRPTNSSGVIWSNLTIMTPYLKLASLPNGDFAYAGLEADLRTNQPAPPDLLAALTTRTNLVAYDWELTGSRIEQWLYFGQFLRFIVNKAQIPPKSASFAWLTAITPNMGNCVTMVTKTGPNQLVFGRKSDLGFNSAELDLLADWLESPRFPEGLNTMLGQPSPLPPKRLSHSRSQTNSVPAAHH